MADKQETPGSEAAGSPVPEAHSEAARRRREEKPPRGQRGLLARWLRRLIIALLVIGVLALLVFVAVTLLLRSDLPRSLAESAAGDALGLDVGLGRTQIGWSGDISVEDIELREPAENGEGESVLEIPELRTSVGSLPRVAMDYLRGRAPQIRRLELESPTIYATKDEQGEWNLQRIPRLLRAARSGKPQEKGGGIEQTLAELPAIEISDATLVLRDAEGKQARIEDVDLTGQPEGRAGYRLSGGAPGVIDIDAKFSPGSIEQELEVTLHEIPDDVREILNLPQIAFDASWDGTFADGGLDGTLNIRSAQVAGAQISGEVKAERAGGVTRFQVRDLRASNLPAELGPIVALEGGGSITGSELRIEDLLLHVEPGDPRAPQTNGEILVDSAVVSLDEIGGSLRVRFKNIQPGDRAHLSGALSAQFGYDAFGEPAGEATLEAFGSIAETSFERLALRVLASGPNYHDWGTVDVVLTLLDSPLLIRPPDAPTTLPEAEARIAVRLNDPEQPRIELASLRSLNPDIMELRGWGVYFTAAGKEHQAGDYLVSFEQRGLPVKLPRVEEKVPLHLGFDLKGRYYRDPDPARTVIAPIQITRIFGELAEVELDGYGQYVIVVEGEEPDPPLSLTLTLSREARIPAPVIPAATDIITAQARLARVPTTQEIEAPQMPTEQEAIQIEPIRGRIESWLEIAGDPAQFTFHGSGGVQTSNFAVGAMELGTIRTDIELSLNREYLTIYTPANEQITDLQWQYAQLFGARLDFEAEIPFKPDQPGHITLDIAEMQIGLASQALGLPAGASGTLDGKLDIDLTGLSLRQAVARGWFTVEDLKVPQAEIADRMVIGIPPRQDGDDARGGVLLADGMFNVPVELQQMAELAPGPTLLGEERTLGFNFAYDLRQPRQLQFLNLKADGYPIVFPPEETGGRYIDTELSLAAPAIFIEFNQGLPQVRGNIAGAMQVWTGREPFNVGLLADGEIELEATRDRVDLEDLFIDLPEIGVVTGGGMLDLTDLPARSRIYLHGQALNLEALAWRLGMPEGATGLADFSLSIQPGPGEHPQGEVLVNFAFSGDHARWRSVTFDQGQVMAYLSRVPLPDESPLRGQFDFTLVTTERIYLEIAGGTIDGYFKLRNRGRAQDADPSVFSPLASFGDDWYVNGTMDARGLALGQLARVIEQDEVAGILNVSAIAYGNLNQKPPFGEPEQDLPRFPLSGEGSLAIEQGELRNFNLFQRILDLVNQLTRLPQRDSLEARFRMETGHLYVDSLEAYIDGTEIRMAGRLNNVLDPGVTTMQASGVVMLRPLSQIPLPFFREADDIFGVIQTNATAFRAYGPFKNPTVVQALWSEIGETLRVLLVPNLKRR